MKATLYDLAAGTRLRDVVPPAYRDAVSRGVKPEGVYFVLLFGHAERDVVPSPPVGKAPRRLKDVAADGIVAVGTVFTDEALALLAEARARVVTFRTARGTDESARARQL